jgi:hypothetical protein
MISLLISILILLIIFGIAWYVIDLFPGIPAQIKQIVKAIVGLVLILILLGSLFGLTPLPVLR